MTRIYPDFVYGDGPRRNCFWDETCDVPQVPGLDGNVTCDIAIVGAGFTGLNAALELRAAGVDVVILDAKDPGWGASGRNGGFCCLGGSKLDDAALDRQFGKEARLEWRHNEVAAVQHVEAFLEKQGVDVDRHSKGETWLAHRPREMVGIEQQAAAIEENYGVAPSVHSAMDLDAIGLTAGFHGGVTIPLGFGLNPRKYLASLVEACLAAGVSIYRHAKVSALTRRGGTWMLSAGQHAVCADQVIIATNGYSSENMPDWLAGRYMPAQSTVGVTPPLSTKDLEAQGWTSSQMVYDSRNLLHYFRLMPDRRMLFGMRGGVLGTEGSDQRAHRRLLSDFHKMFPAWQHVRFAHLWSGMVCLARSFHPIVGPNPLQPGVWLSMCYHGNGVAMGSLCGSIVARLAMGMDDRPDVLKQPAARFPFGRARRGLMFPAYLGFMVQDR